MTGPAAEVLAKIDGALTEYGYIENDGGGMRWRPEEPAKPERTVCEDDEGDWPDPDDGTWGPFTVRVHFRVPGKGWNVCVKAEARSAQEMPGMAARACGERMRRHAAGIPVRRRTAPTATRPEIRGRSRSTGGSIGDGRKTGSEGRRGNGADQQEAVQLGEHP